MLDYSLIIGILPIRWRSKIIEYNPPHNFEDIQLKGPSGYWQHSHLFAEIEEGTVITDIFEYALPLGFLGDWANGLFVKK